MGAEGRPRAGGDPTLFADQIDSVLAAVGYENPNAKDPASADAKPKLHLKANFFASAVGWDKLMRRPELGELILLHTEYLASQAMMQQAANAGEEATPLDDLPDVRSAPEKLMRVWFRLVEDLVADATPEEREKIAYYFTVGSVNHDYRSMVLNAETMIIATQWPALSGFLDFRLLPGLCEWVRTQEEIDALLPPPSSLHRAMSNFLRILL